MNKTIYFLFKVLITGAAIILFAMICWTWFVSFTSWPLWQGAISFIVGALITIGTYHSIRTMWIEDEPNNKGGG